MYLKSYKVAFMGTPEFARDILAELMEYDWLSLELVVTQPDRKVGRKQLIQYSAVKQYALDQGLLICQPSRVGDIYEQLKSLQLDAIITCAYGQYIPSKILNLTHLGVINIHASLLPKYRGGAPMQYVLMKGEEKTGISLMRSSQEMDAGDVFSQIEIQIDAQDNLASLETKLIAASMELLRNDLLDIFNEEIKPRSQDHLQASFSPTIKREDEKLDLNQSVKVMYNHIRALNPEPLVFTRIDQKLVKIKEASYSLQTHNYPLGEIVAFDKNGLKIAGKDGFLVVLVLQVEGKKLSEAKAIFNGYQQWIGQRCHD